MNTLIKNFIFALLCIVCIQLLFAVFNPALAAGGTVSLEPDSGGMFDKSILDEMHKFMLKTYKALCKVLMTGHALMCYGRLVDYKCILACAIFKLPNLNFLIVGFLIYATGILISMSLGMYFVDISFKIGFSIIMMPISIALWPFPPTNSKFGENLSIIIRNAMLFMLLGLGVTYCTKLIIEGTFEDGQRAFWDAIENAENEKLTHSFSLFSRHIFVVFFCLMYGFKIIEGSVNNYLSAFFSDKVFGSESPMHHMGTQAVGMAYANAVQPALSFTKDVAMNQAGKAVSAVGEGMVMVSTSSGRQQLRHNIGQGYNKAMTKFNSAAQTVADAIEDPGAAYTKVKQSAAQGAVNAINKAGSAVKSAHDTVTALAPTIGLRESWRQEQVNRFDKLVDKMTSKAGRATKRTILHGDENLVRAIKNPKETYNRAMQKAGAVANRAVQVGGEAVKKTYRAGVDIGVALGKDDQWREQKLTNFNANVDAVTDIIGDGAETVIAHGGGYIKSGLKESAKQTTAAIGAVAINTAHTIKGDKERVKVSDVRAQLHQKHENVQQAINNTIDGIKKDINEMKDTADKAPVSLAPTRLKPQKSIKSLFGMVKDPIGTVGKLTDNIGNLQASGGRVILKKSGQIVFRTIKDMHQDRQKAAHSVAQAIRSAPNKADQAIRTGAKAVEGAVKTVSDAADKTLVGKYSKKAVGGTVGILGKVLKNVGKEMSDNSARAPENRKERFSLKDWMNDENLSDEERERKSEAADRANYHEYDTGDNN